MQGLREVVDALVLLGAHLSRNVFHDGRVLLHQLAAVKCPLLLELLVGRVDLQVSLAP
jgi:hypothetical protein